MSWHCLLGLPLDEALARLRMENIEPEVVVTRAPRRPEGVGVARVVRISEAEGRITVCYFDQELEGGT